MAKRYHQSMKGMMSKGMMSKDMMSKDMMSKEMMMKKMMMMEKMMMEKGMMKGMMKGNMMMDRMGEARYEAMEGREFYAGRDSRRMQEKMDSMMISEDHNAMANMPTQVMMKYWPKEGGMMPEYLDDTIGGIDSQMEGDDAYNKRGFDPHKF